MSSFKRSFAVLSGGIVLLAVCVLLLPLFSTAQSPTYPSTEAGKELDERIQRFFNELMNSNSTKAFEDLLRSAPPDSATGNSTTAEMKTKLDDIKKQFGEFQSFEKIDEKPIVKSNDLVIVRYLMKCDYHPVVWTFIFYRCPVAGASATSLSSPWQVVGLRFDTNLDLLSL